MARAKQLDEEEKAEKLGKNIIVVLRIRDFVLYIASQCMNPMCCYKLAQMCEIHISYSFSVHNINRSDLLFAF